MEQETEIQPMPTTEKSKSSSSIAKKRRLGPKKAPKGDPSNIRNLERDFTKDSPKKKRKKIDELEGDSSDNDSEWQVSKTVEEQRDDVLSEVANDLAEKIDAKNVSLSSVNVKSILHHLLTDKLLVEFAQRVALEASDNEIKASNDLGGETIITRSKWKRGKKDVEPEPKFFETDLTEDSEDEEYDPERESNIAPSDDESISTSFSDQRSPSLPRTPDAGLAQLKEVESLESFGQDIINKEDDYIFKIPGVPLSTSKSNSSCETQEEIIAYRTRSKISMRDLSLDALTASLEPPDYDPALYDFKQSDELDPDDLEWQKWLSNLFTQDEVDESVEETDEDFNFMAVEEEVDQEEFRTDKGVRITQKELEDLLDGILDDFGDNIEDQSTILKYVIPKFPMTESQRLQLAAQLQQHTQLLTQTYILSYKDPLLEKESRNSKELLQELANFRRAVEKDTSLRNKSAYCFSGLEDAIRIVETINEPFDLEEDLLKKNNMPVQREAKGTRIRCREMVVDLPPRIALKIMAEPFFAMYPDLVPRQGVMATEKLQELSKEASRLKFFRCEDNLLAMGLAQFGRNFELISKHLLPIATPKQLKTRAKNLNSKREDDQNPVKVFRKTNKLPPLKTNICVNTPRRLSSKSIKDSYQELSFRIGLPVWVDKFYELLNCVNVGSVKKTVPEKVKYKIPIPTTKFRPIASKIPITPMVPRIVRVPLPANQKQIRAIPVAKAVQTGIDSTILISASPQSNIMPNGLSIDPKFPLQNNPTPNANLTFLSIGNTSHVLPTILPPVQPQETMPTITLEQISHANIVTNDPPLLKEPTVLEPLISDKQVLIVPEGERLSDASSLDRVTEDLPGSSVSHATEIAANIVNEPELSPDIDAESSPMQSNVESGNCSLDEEAEDLNEDSAIEETVVDKPNHEHGESNSKSLEEMQGEDSIGEDNAIADEDVMKGMGGDGNAEEQKLSSKESPKERITSRAASNVRRKKTAKSFNWEEKLQEKASKFADLYFEKVKETLSEKQELYRDFLKLIDEAGRQEMNRVQVYWKLSEIFVDYPELVEMFVGFLEPAQAREVDQFKTWLEFDKARNFLLSCEAFFVKTKYYHQLLKKKIKLHESEKDSKKYVDSIKSLFRGNNELIAEMSSMFPDLSPPQSRNEDFEVIRYRPDKNGFDHVDEFEEVKLKACDYIDAEEPQQRKKTILDDFAAWLQKPALNAAEQRLDKNELKKNDAANAARNEALQPQEVVLEGEKIKDKDRILSAEGERNVSADFQMLKRQKDENISTQGCDSNGTNDARRALASRLPMQTSNQSFTTTKRGTGKHSEDIWGTCDIDKNSGIDFEKDSIQIAVSKEDNCPASSYDSQVTRTEAAEVSDNSLRSPHQVSSGGAENEQKLQSTPVGRISETSSITEGTSPLGTQLTTFRLNVQNRTPTAGFQRIGLMQDDCKSHFECCNTDETLRNEPSVAPFTSSPNRFEDTDVSVDAASDDDGQCNDSHSEMSSTDSFVPAGDVLYDDTGKIVCKWTRDDDRLILTTCQQNGAVDLTFASIAEKLPGRTKIEVRERFLKLMELLSAAAAKA